MAHMTKHELKHDEMLDVSERVRLWWHNNEKAVTAVLIVFLVLLIGWRGYNAWQDSKHARSSNDLAEAMKSYGEALAETEEAKRKELFNTAISEAQKIIDEYPSLYAARAAQMLIGNSHYYLAAGVLGKATESQPELKSAQQAYQKYIDMANTPEEKAAGKLALGNTLENILFTTKNMSLMTEAQAAYKDVESLAPNSFLAAEAKLAQARLMQAQAGRQDEARKLYEEVASSRKVEVAAKKKDKDAEQVQDRNKDESLQGVSPKQAEEIRSFSDLSLAREAQQALAALKGSSTAEATATK